jgi:hypothetical protein
MPELRESVTREKLVIAPEMPSRAGSATQTASGARS